MNILFLMKAKQVGGIESVTNILAHKFVDEGHNVSIVYFTEFLSIMKERTHEKICYHKLDGFNMCRKNIKRLREILINEKTEIIINQWGLPFIPTRVAVKAKKGLSIKYISVYHNDPKTNARLKKIEEQFLQNLSILKRGILKIKWYLFRLITGLSMHYVYKKSDIYVLLSKSFEVSFKKNAFLRNISKVIIISNPLTIELKDINKLTKKKEILFVGRIENNQKRIDRILEVWYLLYPSYKDWKLVIVGEGEDSIILKEKARSLQLENIDFVGYQNPLNYYKDASILLMTSEFEGYPLVFAEAMSYGVIPIALGSYSAIYDIINSTHDGIIVNSPFDKYIFKTEVEKLMKNEHKRNIMSENAIVSSNKFDINPIYKKWVEIFC